MSDAAEATPGGLSEHRRRAYLAAMGIPVWVQRDAEDGTGAAAPCAPAPVADRPEHAPTSAGDALAALRAEVAGCTRCVLHTARANTVFGVGDPQARCLIVGEGPGAEEDRTGEPFVGRAGKLLDAMLIAAGMAREQVYIANIVKCRPPGNRDPRVDEVAACAGYLARQIELVSPEVILALGRVAAQNLLGTDTAIGRLRGREHVHGDTGLPVVVTYHPAYLLRTPAAKSKTWSDLRRLRTRLGMGVESE